jgi:hypothetical protein
MLVVESEEKFLEILKKSLKEVGRESKNVNPIIGGWDNVIDFLGIGKHQIKQNYKSGFYGDALQIQGHSVVLNTQRFWEILKSRK